MTSFITSLSQDQLVAYVSSQLNMFFPDGRNEEAKASLSRVMPLTLHRVEVCFSKIKSRYYKKDGHCFFNHLNGDHYSMFLYMLSNNIYKLTGDEDIAAKVFLLNKSLFGIDAFYRIELPEIFMFIHPIGTILGNAKYGNFFVTYQGVSIGSKIDGIYPQFGERNILYSNSSVLGNSRLGANCVVGARSFLMDMQVPDNHVILGSYPGNKIIKNNNPTIDYYFHLD